VRDPHEPPVPGNLHAVTSQAPFGDVQAQAQHDLSNVKTPSWDLISQRMSCELSYVELRRL